MADIIEALDPSRELLNLHQGITGGAWFLHRQLGSDQKLLKAAAHEKGEDL